MEKSQSLRAFFIDFLIPESNFELSNAYGNNRVTINEARIEVMNGGYKEPITHSSLPFLTNLRLPRFSFSQVLVLEVPSILIYI